MNNYNEDNNNEKTEDSSVDIKEIADTKGKSSYLQLSKLQNSINECSLKNIINNVNNKNVLSDVLRKQTNILHIINLPILNFQVQSFQLSTMLSNNILINKVSPISNGLINGVTSQFSTINADLNYLISNPLIGIMTQISETHRSLINGLLGSIIVANPLFGSLTKVIDDIREDPNSIDNWYHYYDKMSEFFWVIPYKMEAKELHRILSITMIEKDFDNYIIKYFNKDIVNSLIIDIKSMLKRKEDIMLFKQIITAYNNKCYALSNLGLISIIDNLLSYYLLNKGCNVRLKMFEPIIDELYKMTNISDDFIFVVMMVNSNINLLYENLQFNGKVKIYTNKKVRRHSVAHGKLYSNKKIDCIMLLNTVYYLLIIQYRLNEYKDSLCHRKGGFYIPDEIEKKKIMLEIKKCKKSN